MTTDNDNASNNGKPDAKSPEITIPQKVAAIGKLMCDLHGALHACELFSVERQDEVAAIAPRIKALGKKPTMIPTGNFAIIIKLKMPPKVVV